MKIVLYFIPRLNLDFADCWKPQYNHLNSADCWYLQYNHLDPADCWYPQYNHLDSADCWCWAIARGKGESSLSGLGLPMAWVPLQLHTAADAVDAID